MSDSATDTLTPEQVRTMGDASADQRAELRQLLQTKIYELGWRNLFYADVMADRGLTTARAAGVLNWLRGQANRDGTPVHFTSDQADEILELLSVRLTPAPFAKLVRDQLTAGTMTYAAADLALKDLRRSPLRELPIPTAAGKVRTVDVPDGQYSLRGTDARTRHYKVTSDVAGGREIKHLNGPRRKRLVGNATEVQRILALIAADPAAAAKLYAEETKRCAAPLCNRPLWDKNQPGYPHGYGETCWTRILAARKIRDHLATIPDAD